MTLLRRHIALFFLLVMLSPAGLVSCVRAEKAGAVAPEAASTTPVTLALRLGSSTATKADFSVITEMGPNHTFRGLEQIRLLPFASASGVSAGDTPLFYVMSLPQIDKNGLVGVSNAHLYGGSGVELPLRTASALVYGRAPRITTGESIQAKHADGVLREIGLSGGRAYVSTASELSFVPETMMEAPGIPRDALTGTPTAAQSIAEVLSAIVLGDSFHITAWYDNNTQTYSVDVPWDASLGDENLRKCYEDITVSGALMPGSGPNVETLLTNLYRAVYNYQISASSDAERRFEIEKEGVLYQDVQKQEADGSYSPLTYRDIYLGVRQLILDRFQALFPDPDTQNAGVITLVRPEGEEAGADYTAASIRFVSSQLRQYPENLGLPSGAAAVRWTRTGYVVPLENGLDGIAPISSYCYPPPLYYFVNTTLRTSNAEGVEEVFNQTNYWKHILAHYKDGDAVSSSTRSVALKDSLQFAVGMLCGTVRVKSDLPEHPEMLQDNDGLESTRVQVTGTRFPLTGVIIGRQYATRFDFTPRFESETASKQYYLFDDQVPSGIYLHVRDEAAGETLREFRTLSLETPLDKEVYFALEFRNDSGESFYGAEGRIYPGRKFYLVGKLDFPEGTEFHKIFLRDHVTTAPCVIKSFKNAHSAVPDLGIPQLTLGVETRINWIMSDPATVLME